MDVFSCVCDLLARLTCGLGITLTGVSASAANAMRSPRALAVRTACGLVNLMLPDAPRRRPPPPADWRWSGHTDVAGACSGSGSGSGKRAGALTRVGWSRAWSASLTPWRLSACFTLRRDPPAAGAGLLYEHHADGLGSVVVVSRLPDGEAVVRAASRDIGGSGSGSKGVRLLLADVSAAGSPLVPSDRAAAFLNARISNLAGARSPALAELSLDEVVGLMESAGIVRPRQRQRPLAEPVTLYVMDSWGDTRLFSGGDERVRLD
jgi:hypothetical protein